MSILSGESIKELRERKLMTQRDLSEEAGIDVSSISRIELGISKPRFSTVRKLTKALDAHEPSTSSESKSKYPSDNLDKFMLRLPEGMREKIKAHAEENGRSMNSEITHQLNKAYS